MAWADVYVQKATLSPTTAATSHTVTPSTAFTAGNFAVLIVSSASAVTTPSGWTLAHTPPSFDTRPTILYRTVPAGGLSSQAITIATSGRPRIALYEFTSAVSFSAGATWTSSTWNADPGQSGQAASSYSGDVVALGVLTAENNADTKYNSATWDGPNYTLSSNRFTVDTSLPTTVGFEPELFVGRLFATGAATYGTRAYGPEGPGTMYRPQGAIIVMQVASGGGAGTLAASLPNLTGSISGASNNPGSLSGSTPKLTGAETGLSTNPATIAASVAALSGSISGQSVNPGALTTTLPKTTGSINGQSINPASLSGALPTPTGSIAGQSANPGALDGTLPRPTGSIASTDTNPATLAGTLPLATAALTGTAANSGSLNVALPKLLGGVSDQTVNAGILAATLPAVLGLLPGQSTNPGTTAAVSGVAGFAPDRISMVALAPMWVASAAPSACAAATEMDRAMISSFRVG